MKRLFYMAIIALFLVVGCKTGSSSKPDSTGQPAEAEEVEPVHGPWSAAETWLAEARPNDLPEEVATIVGNWKDPQVVRMHRADGRYVAVIAGSDADEEVPAVLLTLSDKSGSWEVLETDAGQSTYLWPAL